MASLNLPVVQLGAGFIGQTHSQAMTRASHSRREPSVSADLWALADHDAILAANVAERFGWQKTTTDWTELLNDKARLFVNAGPNDVHIEPSIAAARAGIDVFCEKPLAGTAEEAHTLWKSVDGTGVNHRAAFLHRFIPALQFARRIIQEGDLGEIVHFRSQFLLNMVGPDGMLSWRFDRGIAGSGAVGDLGSHHIDVARYLVGEIKEVQAMSKTWVTDPTGQISDVNDDYFAAVASLENGATAVFEASRIAAAHSLTGRIEVDGTKGSLSFDMERLNEITTRSPQHGFQVRLVTQSSDPSAGFDVPVGIQGAHPVGWNDCFALQAYDVLALAAGAIKDSVAATFEDGYQVAEIVETIEKSAAMGERLPVVMRT